MMHHLDSICLKNRVEYLHRDHESNKLNPIIKSLKIDPTVEMGEGERHLTLLSAADSLLLRYRNKGKSVEDLKKFFFDMNQQLCHPESLPEDELNEIWDSALRFVDRIKDGSSLHQSKETREDGSNIIESTSEQIKKKYRFAALPSKELLYYDNGVYTTGGEIIIDKEAEAICGYRLSNKALAEIKGHITRSCYRNKDDFDMNLDIINMKNGLYNIQTGEFREHSPDYLSLIQLPVPYDPEAKPKLFGKFLSEVIYPTEIRTAVEVMAYTFLRDNPYEIINILFGYGGNGKSVFTGVLTSIHGNQNVSNVPLRAMINDPYALSDLEGKSVNIDTELSSTSIEDTAVIKKLTGRQPIRIQRKHQRAYDTILHAKPFFNTNKIPLTYDTSDAFFRRCCIVSFPNNFEAKDDPDLYRAYVRFCKEKRLAVESKENFGKILKKQFRYQDGREASGARRTIWKGVKLTGTYNLEDEQQMLAA